MNGTHLAVLVFGVLVGAFYKNVLEWFNARQHTKRAKQAGYEYAKYFLNNVGDLEQLRAVHGPSLDFTKPYDCGIANYIEVHNDYN